MKNKGKVCIPVFIYQSGTLQLFLLMLTLEVQHPQLCRLLMRNLIHSQKITENSIPLLIDVACQLYLTWYFSFSFCVNIFFIACFTSVMSFMLICFFYFLAAIILRCYLYCSIRTITLYLSISDIFTSCLLDVFDPEFADSIKFHLICISLVELSLYIYSLKEFFIYFTEVKVKVETATHLM